MSDATIRRPDRRTCESCGRTEVWSDEHDTWEVAREDGTPQTGNIYCIHEWDINGTFVPVEDANDPARA